MKEFFIQNRDTIVSLLGGVIAFLRGVTQFYQSQKQQLEIENLKSQLEIQKHQTLLNDKKFREGYEDFVNLMMDIMNEKKILTKTDRGIISFMKKAILFAGSKTIKAFGEYRKDAGKEEGDNNTLKCMDDLLFNMREDLGVDNGGLEQYDILQTFVIGDIKKEVAKK